MLGDPPSSLPAHLHCPPDGVILDQVLVTRELERRPTRAPEHAREARALLTLSRDLADHPHTILQNLATVVLDTLQAGSAGVSLISHQTGDFYWAAIAGAWTQHIGGCTPRGFSLCSVVLELGTPQLFSHPENYFSYLLPALPLIHEVLLCPFFVDGVARGTVWAVSHEAAREFDAEDCRLLTSLSTLASAAYQSIQHTERLRTRQEQFREFADNLPSILWITETDESVSFLSRDWFDYTGQTESEALGFGWLDATHPEDRERTAHTFSEACQQRKNFVMEYRLRHQSGEYRWVTDSGRPRYNQEGKYLGYTGAVVDIHARKLSEQHLKEANLRLEAELNDTRLLQQISSEMAQADTALVMTQIMDAAQQIMGADFVSLQVVQDDPAHPGEPDALIMLAQRGYSVEAAEHWRLIRTDHPTCCGVALKSRLRCFVPDTFAWEPTAGSKDLIYYQQVGIRSVQSTPLISRTGDFLGVLSTAWKVIHEPSERDWRMFEVLARHTADLMERIRADQQLLDREAQILRGHKQLEALYQQSPVGMLQLDAELRFVRINAALAAMNGVSPADHIGKTIHEIVPELASTAEPFLRGVLETGEPVIDIELQGATQGEPDPNHIWLESWYPLRDERNQVIGVNVVAQDITRRKLVEKRLQLISDTIARLLQTRDAGVLVRQVFEDVAAHLNVDTYFNYMVDESGEYMVLHSYAGISAETAAGIKQLDFGEAICGTVAQTRVPVHAANIQQTDDEQAALVRGMGIQVYACNPLMIGDRLLGTLSFASHRATHFDDDALQFMRIIAQYTAVALDRIHAEAALDRARQTAEDASKAKDKFMAMLSHELRTPLTPVLMTVATLDQNEALDPGLRQDIALIRRNVELEARLIDDLLDLSRIISGKLILHTEVVDLAQAIQYAMETCRSFVELKQLKVNFTLPERVLYVHADPARLQQVLWNLIRNAAKFTPERGMIEVGTAIPTPDRVQIVVRDNGLGMTSEVLGRIFNAFDQGDAAISHQYGGMGLGLAISKAIMELHHGRIWASSEGLGFGSTFTLELPIHHAAASSVIPSKNSPKENSHLSLRLLLVEDHADTSMVLSRLLRKRGYHVTVARTATQALEIAEQEAFDVLLSDLGLPDISGYELMQQMRNRYAIRGIAMSGFGMEEDMRRSWEAGFSDHLVKPVNITQLEKAIRRSASDDIG